LTDNTLRLYVSAAGPEAMAAGDSFASLISQTRLAGEVWNTVKTSELRIAFGGLIEEDVPQSVPGIDVVFDEIPPGVIALGGPTVWADTFVTDGDEVFLPITRSVVILNKDLSLQPTSGEDFFMTLVHEIGHALGLQHTLTSSVMSTSVTRSTSKASPLEADDVAGISALYPTAEFAASTAAISGRVLLGSDGVNLASVVAISPQGTAVSTLTNPDGSYRIAGLPPGQYYVYAHPLPPPLYGEVSPANIRLPRDSNGEPVPVGAAFRTQFYPGVQSVETAASVRALPGETVEHVNFFVTARSAPELYAVSTYTFPGNVAVSSAHMSLEASRRYLVSWGVGLSTGTAPTPGVRASVIGGSAWIPDGGLVPYEPDPRFVRINLDFHPFSGVGARHLLFSYLDDIYVLPAGLRIVSNMPPSIASLALAPGDTSIRLAVEGTNLSASTTILFDGVPGRTLGLDELGRLLVEPPAAGPEHRATVVALNDDGQSSWFMNGSSSPVYEYGAAPEPELVFPPISLAAGSEAMIEIRGVNTHFKDGETVAGFGSSDVAVRDVFVLDPTLALANVAVAPSASETVVSATLVNGLEVVTGQAAIQVLPADAGRLSAHSPLLLSEEGTGQAYPGSMAALRVSNLFEPVAVESVTATLNDVPMAVESVGDGIIVFRIPSSLDPGPKVARVRVGEREAAPILVRLVSAPPLILDLLTGDGISAVLAQPLHAGDTLQVVVTRVAPGEQEIAPERVRVFVGGIGHLTQEIFTLDADSGTRLLQLRLGAKVAAGDSVPLTVVADGNVSNTRTISLAGQ
jgi:uncharacterized protein (TIGR03437 family)